MLTNSQVSVLQILQAQPRHVATVEHLKSVLGDEISMTISHLNNIGYACYTWQNDRPDHVMLTPEGFNALEGHLQLQEELRAERADQEARTNADEERKRLEANQNRKQQFRHDWRIAIFSAAVSFISGLIVAHFIDIAGYCATLLHSVFNGFISLFH